MRADTHRALGRPGRSGYLDGMAARRRTATPARTAGSAPRLRGLPPIADAAARVLVLGSMPGAASLAAGQYYAHSQNAFWPIVEAVVGIDRGLDYAERCARLAAAGIAVWDVLASCVRPGSLDADIDPASIATNDFAAFFAAHPRIAVVCCNGATALACYRRRVVPSLAGAAAALPVVALPSTSPAHASLGRAEKIARWRDALAPHLG